MSGTFVTEEVRLTDNFEMSILGAVSDEKPVLILAIEDGKKILQCGSDQLGGYKDPVLFSMDWVEEEVAEETRTSVFYSKPLGLFRAIHLFYR